MSKKSQQSAEKPVSPEKIKGVSKKGADARVDGVWEKTFPGEKFKWWKPEHYAKYAYAYVRGTVTNYFGESEKVKEEEQNAGADASAELKDAIGGVESKTEDADSGDLEDADSTDVDSDSDEPSKMPAGSASVADEIENGILDEARDEADNENPLSNKLVEMVQDFSSYIAYGLEKARAEKEAAGEKVKDKGEVPDKGDAKKLHKKLPSSGLYTLFKLRDDKRFNKWQDLAKFFDELDKAESKTLDRWKNWMVSHLEALFDDDELTPDGSLPSLEVLADLFPKTFEKSKALPPKKLRAALVGLLDKKLKTKDANERLGKLAFLWNKNDLKKLARALNSGEFVGEPAKPEADEELSKAA